VPGRVQRDARPGGDRLRDTAAPGTSRARPVPCGDASRRGASIGPSAIDSSMPAKGTPRSDPASSALPRLHPLPV
jgi:hypothetical protein